MVGGLAGVAVALLLNVVNPFASAVVGVPFPVFPLGAAFALGFGAMVGDIAASFLKRRSGRERGAAFPGLDQLDFVVGALALTALVAPAWFAETFTVGALAVVLLATPVLHLVTNVVAYGIGVKNEPY